MITSNISNYSSNKIKAKVELYNGSTLVTTCTCSDVLSNFNVSREGELGKFFGFGVGQSLKMSLIDIDRVLSIKEGFTAKVCLGDGEIFDCPYPDFTMTDVVTDKKSGDITITAFDPLYKASETLYEDLGIVAPYTIKQLAEDCAMSLGVTLNIEPYWEEPFNRNYPDGANFSGKETLRAVLNQIAEVTQTIYFINNKNELVFIQLGVMPVAEYDERDYYEFETGETRTLKGICSATELGENIEAVKDDVDGVIQYVRDNPFWDTLEGSEVAYLLNEAIHTIVCSELVQFDLDWTGNHLLEIGDCICVYHDMQPTILYVLNDVITYAGTLSERTSWSYKDNDTDTPANTSNLGDKLNQTFAKVDKINKTITLKVADATETAEGAAQRITSLEANIDGINSEVSSFHTSLEETNGYINQQAEQLRTVIEQTEQALKIEIENSKEIGSAKEVTTTTGYTFGANGLIIEKSENDISTKITNDGMTISLHNEELLSATDEGVNATDLHARTYLIIGGRSRFENYTKNAEARTGCFWIGD